MTGPSLRSSRTTAGASTADATRDDVLGLVGMRERVGLVGGRLRVESTVGSGTTVAAEVPIP